MNKPPPGWNPLRWDCGARGCYNVKHRPKIEMFAECFPGKIAMGDIDGMVEINSRFLLLEWKTVEKPLPLGQRITYERLTRNAPVVVMIVTGNPETMDVARYSLFIQGHETKPIIASLDDVKQRIRSWCSWAQRSDAA